MKFSDLMTLAEASTGFSGGTIVDEMPHMSLSECAGALPMAIMSEQISLQESVAKINDQMVEAAISALQTGSMSQYDTIVEGAFETIKNKIAAVFEKIKKFIKSIIAKLTLQIDKFRMTGKQLLSKYKNSEMLNHSFDDLVVNGYKFEKKDPFTSTDTYISDPQGLIAKGVPDIIRPEQFASWAPKFVELDQPDAKEEADKQYGFNEARLDKINDTSSDERKLAFAEAMTNGIDMSAGSWVSDLKKELYGDKVDLTYGTDFTLDSVKKDLEGEDLAKIKQGYEKLLKAVNSDESALQKAADKFKKDNKPTEQGKDQNRFISLANKYFTAYLSIYQDCTGVISTIQSIRVDYEKAKVNQAKNIFARMLTYKKKDKNEDASDIDEIDVLSMDI